MLGFLTKESKPVGNGTIGNALEKNAVGGGLGNALEKKTGVPGGLGNLLENKKGVLGGGLSVAVEKKAGFGQLLNKNLGNTAEKKGGGFGNIIDKKGGSAAAFGKMSFGAFGKRGAVKPGQGADDQHGILEGISSLHSWIKSQTMIKPNQKMKGKHAALFDEASKLAITGGFKSYLIKVLLVHLGNY